MNIKNIVPNLRQGFLLTRHAQDVSGLTGNGLTCKKKAEIVYWVSTDQGPVKIIVEDEKIILFVLESDQLFITEILKPLSNFYQWKSLALKSFSQQPIAALYFGSVHHFYDAQSLLQNANITLYENDIRSPQRYLMERFVFASMEFTGKPVQRKGYTEYRQAKVRPSTYEPRFCWLSFDVECSWEGELFSFALYGKNQKLAQEETFKAVFMIGEPENSPAWIYWVKDERALLLKLEQQFTLIDPDILIGWNVVNFDFKLILKRAELQGVKLKLGRAKSYAGWRESRSHDGQGFISLPGRVIVDGIDALKTATYNFPSFSLENVSQTLLGRGKKVDDHDNRVDEILENFKHHKQKLAEYNLEDTVLVWDIFQKTQVLDYLVFRSQLTGLELDKMGGSVAAFTYLYLPKLHRAGYVAPNLPQGDISGSPGGYVMDSKPGLYHNVLVLDYKSLYPSIIRTFKIDPLGLIEGLKQPELAIEGFRGGVFSREQHFLPDIISSLLQQREQAKLDNDQPRSQAIKILMNSFYGVLGSSGCRFYDARLASSITMRGHEIMKQTTHWIKEYGYEVIYGDTDSTFVLLEQNATSQNAQSIGQKLVKQINQKWKDKLWKDFKLDSFLEVEFETHFTRFLMPTIRGSEVGSKKRYAGLVQKQGQEQLVFKGLETVRTDWTELAKIFQKQLYQAIFHDQDPSKLVKQIVLETLDKQHDHQLTYRKRLRRPLNQYVNTPPHVRAARIADEINRENKRPLQYQNKGWISYVITLNGAQSVDYQTDPIDYEHYIQKQIKPVADAILPFVGLSFDDLNNAQMKLF